MKIEIHVINAFSINGTGGNPAGVVLNADDLSSQEKQNIAAKAGFPETAFVSASKVADYKLDFFTPIKQIPHCGHATIATFSFLKQQGMIKGDRSSKETIDGCRSIIFKDGEAFMEQQSPTFKPFEELPALLDALQISSECLLAGLEPYIVNTGNSFLIVPVKNESILESINYNTSEVYELSHQ
jgi:PhzF family phenazine biosynthesis protein